MNATLNNLTIIPFTDRPSIQIILKGTGQDARHLTANKELLAAFARQNGVSKVFAPHVALARGRVARPESFGSSVVDGVCCNNSIQSEGTLLRSGDALCLATGDCPVVVMYSHERPNKVVAAHAGRDAILKGVVGNMLRVLGHRLDTRHVRAYIALGIHGENFAHPCDHPEYGAYNRWLVRKICKEYGPECVLDHKLGTLRLDLLVKKRCMQLGIPGKNVVWDRRDTFSDVLPDGSPAWHSHRRDGTKIGRNLVFVKFG